MDLESEFVEEEAVTWMVEAWKLRHQVSRASGET